MRIGQIGLLVMAFSDLVHLLASPPPFPLNKTLVSGYMQEQVGAQGLNAKLSTIERGGRVVSVNRRRGGGGGGGSGGAGNTGGSSGSPYTGSAGTGVVPVFVAGTITHGNKNHHGAGSSIGGYVGLIALGAIILISLILQCLDVIY